MKYLIPLVLLFGLVGCNEQPDARYPNTKFKQVATIGEGFGYEVYEVEIQGETYLATRVHGGVCLCPKK